MAQRALYGIQLLGTLLIPTFVPTSLGKLVAFLVWWALTFRTLTRPEAVMVGVACVLHRHERGDPAAGYLRLYPPGYSAHALLGDRHVGVLPAQHATVRCRFRAA